MTLRPSTNLRSDVAPRATELTDVTLAGYAGRPVFELVVPKNSFDVDFGTGKRAEVCRAALTAFDLNSFHSLMCGDNQPERVMAQYAALSSHIVTRGVDVWLMKRLLSFEKRDPMHHFIDGLLGSTGY